MNPRDIEKLLGGYATGTLTPEERAALFAAALESQALFDALADEEALRELLADPRARSELLAALRAPAPARRRGIWAWLAARPVPAALAASILIAAVTIGVLRQRTGEPRKLAMQRVETGVVPSGDSAPAAAPAPTPLPRGTGDPKPATIEVTSNLTQAEYEQAVQCAPVDDFYCARLGAAYLRQQRLE